MQTVLPSPSKGLEPSTCRRGLFLGLPLLIRYRYNSIDSKYLREHKGISDLLGPPPKQKGWQLHCYSHGSMAGSNISTSPGLFTPPEPEEPVHPLSSELCTSGSICLILCKSHYRREELSCKHFS